MNASTGLLLLGLAGWAGARATALLAYYEHPAVRAALDAPRAGAREGA